MKKILLIILTFLPFLAMAQHTAIPDPNFEQALIDDGIDTDGIINQQVNTADISGLEELNVSFSNISYLTGIEDFINLKILKCSDNNLTSLDFSRNIRLLSVSCYSNQIASIDVSHNPDLLNLDCQGNALAHIDLSHNNKLVTFLATSNNLRSLDLSQNTQLKTVHCGFNKLYKLNLRNGNNPSIEFLNSQNNPDLPCISVDYPADAGSGLGVYSSWYKDASTTYSRECAGITYIPDPNFEQALIDQGIDTDGTLNMKVLTIDISGLENLNVKQLDIYDLIGIEDFINLRNLICGFNYLNSLDLSNNKKLLSVDCENNNIYALKLDNNPELQYLKCKSNEISHLDLSQNPLLKLISVNSNNITSLDLSQNPDLNSVFCGYNNLYELNVKNGNNSSIGYFNAYGSPNLTCIEVDNAAAATAGNGAYATWMIDAASSYSSDCEDYTQIPDPKFEQALINQGIDTDGIINHLVLTSDISAITHLYIYGKSISDLSGIEDFISLVHIDCSSNLLTSLDFTYNTLLNTVICSSNLIKDLKVDQNSALTQLNCNYNQLSRLDLSQNTALSILLVNNNVLTELNLRNGNNTSITILYAFNNPNLLCIEVDNPSEANSHLGNYLNWAKDPVATYSLDCYYSATVTKPLIAGWTWFSINVEAPNTTIGNILSSLDLTDGDYIKNQGQSATYYDGFGWFGSLIEFDPKYSYKINLSTSGNLIIEGLEADLDANQIPIGPGWNWIGYPPKGPIALEQALLSINPQEGDYIKNQSASATFYDDFGWFGDLTQLNPLEGYMLKASMFGTIVYH